MFDQKLDFEASNNCQIVKVGLKNLTKIVHKKVTGSQPSSLYPPHHHLPSLQLVEKYKKEKEFLPEILFPLTRGL